MKIIIEIELDENHSKGVPNYTKRDDVTSILGKLSKSIKLSGIPRELILSSINGKICGSIKQIVQI